MGFDYALVHLRYTIPPAIALTLLYRPLLNRTDLYKIAFLISIAFISTLPWDSYLVRRKVWTYPEDAVIGPTLLSVPAEELFFFVIQTYNTTLLYLILNKPIFHPSYLSSAKPQKGAALQWNAGQLIFVASFIMGLGLIWSGDEGTYLGLIIAWAGPFALLLWSLSSQFLIALPLSSTVVPIAIPTLYLWMVDTLALKRGTWVIESGTKLGIHLWEGLEIEEALFFLVTNVLIVFGLVAFDHALSILLAFPILFPDVPELPSPVLLVQALLTDRSKYGTERIIGIQEAVARLKNKSRSFYLASSAFIGRLRINLVLLYSFCRVADDLIDDCSAESDAREWIDKLTHYLDLAYASKEARLVQKHPDVHSYITENFPKSSQLALRLLPTHLLSYGPLYGLLEGFKTDLEFHDSNFSKALRTFPIANEHDLEVYAARVAGTVAELCLELVFHHTNSVTTTAQRETLIRSGGRMGIALQYVNVARDISTDAAIGRVYLPTSWLKGAGLKPDDVLKNPDNPAIDVLRARLLDKAFGIYREAQPALAQLPIDARAPMRVAVESYMEIGRVLREKGYKLKKGRATVPIKRRLTVAWKALNQG